MLRPSCIEAFAAVLRRTCEEIEEWLFGLPAQFGSSSFLAQEAFISYGAHADTHNFAVLVDNGHRRVDIPVVLWDVHLNYQLQAAFKRPDHAFTHIEPLTGSAPPVPPPRKRHAHHNNNPLLDDDTLLELEAAIKKRPRRKRAAASASARALIPSWKRDGKKQKQQKTSPSLQQFCDTGRMMLAVVADFSSSRDLEGWIHNEWAMVFEARNRNSKPELGPLPLTCLTSCTPGVSEHSFGHGLHSQVIRLMQWRHAQDQHAKNHSLTPDWSFPAGQCASRTLVTHERYAARDRRERFLTLPVFVDLLGRPMEPDNNGKIMPIDPNALLALHAWWLQQLRDRDFGDHVRRYNADAAVRLAWMRCWPERSLPPQLQARPVELRRDPAPPATEDLAEAYLALLERQADAETARNEARMMGMVPDD
jgi:hypothetical protein